MSKEPKIYLDFNGNKQQQNVFKLSPRFPIFR